MAKDFQCGRCGSSILFETCQDCAGDGYHEHDCFDDSCCCLDPEGEVCVVCNGEGLIPICLSSEAWCNTHPLSGREFTPRSTPEEFSVPEHHLRTSKRHGGYPDAPASRFSFARALLASNVF
jgi:hypothetical protein